MRRWKALVPALATAFALVAIANPAGAQSSSEEGRFVELINQLRVAKGVPALTIDAGLAGSSCAWTDHMVAVDTLAHDPNLASHVGSVEANWTKAGENVGVGGDVDLLFNAFVASPAHYRNLVDPAFNAIGVCVTWVADHSRMYTTHRFVSNRAATVAIAAVTPPPTVAPTTAPPATAAPPTTEPPTTVAPTTVPATTTTTTVPAIPVDVLVPVASDALTAGVLVALAASTS